MTMPDGRSDALGPRRFTAEEDFEKALRPTALDDFIGQQKIKDNLRVFMTAALQRGEALDHVLLSGPPGLGKCITPDSLVLTAEGWVPFADLIPGAMEPGTSRPLHVQVYGVGGLEPTSHIYYSGRVPTRRVTTRAGFTLEGTPHHPVLVATAEGPRWKRLEELVVGDHVAIGRGLSVPGTRAEAAWSPASNTDRRRRSESLVRHLHAELRTGLGRPPAAIELRKAYAFATGTGSNTPLPQQTAYRLGLSLADGRQVATESRPEAFVSQAAPHLRKTVPLDADLAYLLGVIVGDGHVEAGNTGPAIAITCEEAEMQAEIQRISQAHFGRTPRVCTYQSRAATLRFSRSIGELCLSFGLTVAGAAEKRIPKAVLRSPHAVVAGFLQGLFDADGHARRDGVEFGTRSEALGREVQILLAGLGIIAYRKRQVKADRPFWTLFIGGTDAVRFYQRVGFRLARKQARAADLPEQRGWSRSDLVPHASGLLRSLLETSLPQPRAVHKAFEHVKRGDRTVSRQQALRLLALLPQSARGEAAYVPLAALCDPRVTWEPVTSIEPSENEAYDFVVPGTHSFVANGFINHNTTLAYIVAEEMGAGITTTSGPVLDKPAAIAGLLTNLSEGDVLFIDEIHRLPPVVEEYLYSAMEDYKIDIVIDSGPNARSVQITLPPFTLVGATTRKGLLTAPMRARFGIDFRYDYYSAELLQKIVERSASILRIPTDLDGAFEIARRSRGTPRIANRLLRRTRDFAEVEGDGRITRAIANHALEALDVDEEGLDDMDKRILLTLIEKFGGGPTGLSNLAVSVGEDTGTIEEVYEPYLIQEGFLERTPRGRIATPRAYAHFGLEPPPRQGDIFPDLA